MEGLGYGAFVLLGVPQRYSDQKPPAHADDHGIMFLYRPARISASSNCALDQSLDADRTHPFCLGPHGIGNAKLGHKNPPEAS